MDIIRALFSSRRPIDRTIEKVIDYYAQNEDRLATEIEEYEITDNVEAAFRKFLDVFSDAVRGGRVTEVGIGVSGFYGSGKSSFTKYLGFALDPDRSVHGKFFLDLLCDRFQRAEVPAALRTVSRRSPSAVIPLDLGAEQLAESVTAPVATVLYEDGILPVFVPEAARRGPAIRSPANCVRGLGVWRARHSDGRDGDILFRQGADRHMKPPAKQDASHGILFHL